MSDVAPAPALSVQVGGGHYKDFPIQPVEFAETNNLTFLEGCVVKRLCRHSRGGKGRQDVKLGPSQLYGSPIKEDLPTQDVQR